MANPKYIKESLLPVEDKDETNKPVSKKTYSFRCDETLLDEINKYADLEGMKLPQLMQDIMHDFLEGKTLTNTYLPEYEGQYISIPSNAADKFHEYEVRYVPNNLDVWTAKYGYISKNAPKVEHEGIDFTVIPETIHTGKLSESEKVDLRVDYSLDLTKVPCCLYCIYITVTGNGNVDYEVISWIDAMNKLKSVGRHDLISHANEIKKKLDSLHNDFMKYDRMYDEEIWGSAYGRLLKIAKDYNTGAILPASSSIDNIEYAAVIEHIPDNYALINGIMEENNKYKKLVSKLDELLEKVDELEKNRDERNAIWEDLKSNPEEDDDLPESDDES